MLTGKWSLRSKVGRYILGFLSKARLVCGSRYGNWLHWHSKFLQRFSENFKIVENFISSCQNSKKTFKYLEAICEQPKLIFSWHIPDNFNSTCELQVFIILQNNFDVFSCIRSWRVPTSDGNWIHQNKKQISISVHGLCWNKAFLCFHELHSQ